MIIVKWCNENQGFVAAILSLLGLILSVIAIAISIATAKRPYKRALRISAGSYFGVGNKGEGQQGIYVNALNVGNVPINVVDVGLMHGKTLCINVNTISNVRGVLKQMEDVEQSFYSKDLQNAFKGEKGKVYAFAKDAEGNIYKKFVCKADRI